MVPRKKAVKLSGAEIDCAKKMRALGLTTFELGEQFNVNRGLIGKLTSGVCIGEHGYFRCIKCEQVLSIELLPKADGIGLKCRECVRDYSRHHARKFKAGVMSHYGGSCYCCGESSIDFLTLDHINNDGPKDRDWRKRHRGYIWVVKKGYPGDLRVACYNCNMGRRHGICPHQRKEVAHGNSDLG